MDSQRKGIYGWFGLSHPIFDPENRFVASPFLSPLVLGIIRLVFAIYMTICIIVEPILLKRGRRTRRDAVKFPAYFTNITFISLAWLSISQNISDIQLLLGYWHLLSNLCSHREVPSPQVPTIPATPPLPILLNSYDIPLHRDHSILVSDLYPASQESIFNIAPPVDKYFLSLP